MTIVEQIVEAVRDLDERRQREVLAMARCLRSEPDVSLTGVDLDDEDDVDGWRERMRAGAAQRVADAMARFRALGLVDADGRIVEQALPPDMHAGSKTSVAT